MGIKIFAPGGIDQKSSDLVRVPEKLRDAQNVQYNTVGEYVKRDGTAVDADFSGDTYNDVVYIKSTGEYFFRNGSNYYRYIEGGVKQTLIKFADPTGAPTSKISLAEYLNTAIFTHEDGQYFTAKYDGRSIYRAGLPAPEITITSGSGNTGFMLNFFEFIDAQGNTIYGPATINNFNISTYPVFDCNSFSGTGFYGGYIHIGTGSTDVTISSSSRTITTVARSSDFDHVNPICVGTKIPVGQTVYTSGVTFNLILITDTSTTNLYADYTVMLEIESITSNTITFTPESIGTKTITIKPNILNPTNILCSVRLRTFISESETTGYLGLASFASSIVDNSVATGTYQLPSTFINPPLLSDFYDITTDKLRPPRCKYVLTYGYQLVYAPALSFWDFKNQETTYTNNDLVMYSDISNGDLGENVTASNRQLIGDTYDGEITGMVRSRDSVVVFKNRSPYALDGVLVPGQYSLRKIETDDIGCVASKSILSVDGVVLFQGQDGIYAINGYACKKFSLPIDKFFRQTVTDPRLTRACLDTAGNKYLFFCDNGVAAFDYEYGEWFIWTALSAPKGVTIDNDGNIKMFRATQAYEFIPAKNDSGVAIDAWIDTAWFDLGEPSATKKATSIRTFALNNAGQTLELKYYGDWTTANTKGPYSIDYSLATTKSILTHLDIIQAQSISFRLGNNVINEDMNLTGFEITCDVNQTKDKNVK